MTPFRSNLMLCLLHAILAFVVIYVMTSGGMGISIDSESYLVSANRFTQQRWDGAFNPIWPPLYPLSIAGIKALGISKLLDAGRMISILSFIILMVTTFLVGIRIQGRFTGHLSAISATFLAPLIYLYCFCWSETIYIMFSLLFFLILTYVLMDPTGPQAKHLILSGIFSGLATITRFVGFSLIGTGILSIFLLSHHPPESKKLKSSLVFLLGAGIPVSFHYLIRFYYFGFMGKRLFESQYSLESQLFRFFSTIYHDFLSFDLSFWKYTFFFKWEFLFPWLSIIVLLGILPLIVLFLKAVFSSRPSVSFLKPQIAVIFYFVLYSIIVLYVSSTVAIDPIGSRFTAPLYPFILLFVFSGIFHVQKTLFQRKNRWWLTAAATIAIGVFLGIQIVSTSSIFKGVSRGSFPAIEHPGNLNKKSLRFLQENVKSDDLIITNIYRKLSLIWPRQEPYPGIPQKEWDNALGEIALEASRRTIYVLICTEDFTPYEITLQDVKKADEKLGLFSWEKIFGNDYLYKTRPDGPLRLQEP